jgi:hypothetical protein
MVKLEHCDRRYQGGNNGLQDFKTSKDFKRLPETSTIETSNF